MKNVSQITYHAGASNYTDIFVFKTQDFLLYWGHQFTGSFYNLIYMYHILAILVRVTETLIRKQSCVSNFQKPVSKSQQHETFQHNWKQSFRKLVVLLSMDFSFYAQRYSYATLRKMDKKSSKGSFHNILHTKYAILEGNREFAFLLGGGWGKLYIGRNINKGNCSKSITVAVNCSTEKYK